MVIIQESIVCW